MEIVYLGIVIFLFVLAVFDLTVGVSNDAVNFLNSAIGAKAASFKTIMIVAAIGIFFGATLGDGMMDIARHGIMRPENFYFNEVMYIFVAVMVTDIVLLDIFNSLGLPTSTTVSMVFDLLGGTFAIAIMKIAKDSTGTLSFYDLLNTEKALTVILGIFLSVAIAFFFGLLVQYIARVIFTFNYTKKLKYSIALFGGIAATSIVYFMLIKGVKDFSFMTTANKAWVDGNTGMIVLSCFVFFTVLAQICHWCKVNVFRLIVLLGTFALAMAFAGNDLVNFIGVPLAGFSSFQDYTANGGGNATGYLMSALNSSAKTPVYFLTAAGIIMVISLVTSKKAYNVVKTSVDLARQDAGNEMFGSSRMARTLVRSTTSAVSAVLEVIPDKTKKWFNSRFNQDDVILANGAAFDMIRASVNLVLSGLLIAVGTSLKLPLSTTYVTFMVAMGSSLADRAWGRESAVFRVTGVLFVIGGWFITAGAAFVLCFLVTLIMYFGGNIAVFVMASLAIAILIRSNIQYKKKMASEKNDTLFADMLATNDEKEAWKLLMQHVQTNQAEFMDFASQNYGYVTDGFINEDLKMLRRAENNLNEEKQMLKKIRRKETIGMQKIDKGIAIEKNTWFHLLHNSSEQMNYCLRRMCEPCEEHIDNSFKPLPKECIKEFIPMRDMMMFLMARTKGIVEESKFDQVEDIRMECDRLKDMLSKIRRLQIDRMQDEKNNLAVSYVYLNVLQETQEMASSLRHFLRGVNKFCEES